MKKRLLLTLLPLTFLVAACSGASEEARSESSKAAQSSSAAAATTSQAATTSEADTSSDSGSTDIRAYDTLKSEGVEVKIGDYYYTMDDQTADPGMNASYNLKNLTVTADEKISIYVDGSAVEAWAQADTANSTYPNYNERPGDSKYSEFTVTTSSESAEMYVHETSTGDYQIWLTPTNDGSAGGGESGGGSTTDSGFGLMIGSTYVAGVADGKDPDGRDQYKITGHTFNEGETFTLYDSANSTGWVEDINPYSFGDTTGAGANTATYLTKGADSYTVVSTFTADVYIKIAWENNDVYFGLSA